MENEHSRLLKFLLPYFKDKSMSKHTLKYEYIIKPSNIESEVPEKQKLRKPINVNSNETNNSNIGPKNDENFVPVLTIKKEETALTKGDIKLQKVLVTENVAEGDNSNTAKIINPFYSEIHSMVIPDPQPFRECLIDTKTDKDQEERKLKTKIPTFKFKQTVEKVQRERKNSSDGQRKIKHPTKGRRSSIPKLRKNKISTSITDDTTLINDNVENNLSAIEKKVNVDKPDEEFEKLFDEIVDHKQVEAVAEKLLPENIENPDELETSFEEIIHAYDDNKIQLEGHIKSKIPLSKQKSLHEESIPRQADRRLSLKNISFGEKNKQNVSQLSKTKMSNDVSKIPVVKKDEHKLSAFTTEEIINKENSYDVVKANGKENKSKSLNEECNNIINDKRSFSPNKKEEISKQKLSKSLDNDIKSEKEVKQIVEAAKIFFDANKDTPTAANISLVQPDNKSKFYLETSNYKLPDSSKMVMNLFSSYEKDVDNNNEVNKKLMKEDEKEKIIEGLQHNKFKNVRDLNTDKIYESSKNQFFNNDRSAKTKDNLNESKPKTSILSKIAIFQNKEASANKEYDKDTKKDLIKQQNRVIIEKENNINVKNTNIKENNKEESKEALKFKKAEMVQEIPNNVSLKRDPTNIYCKKQETAASHSNVKDHSKASKNCIEDSNQKNIDYKEISNEKGRVNDIISRMDSDDKNKLTPKKEEEVEILKKRNVSSKIAIFERQSSKEPITVKENQPENRVEVHTIKEANINDLKPKIIDTVLKSQPLRKSYIEDDVLNPPITNADSKKIDLYKSTHEISTNKVKEIEEIKTNELKSLESTDFTTSKLEETRCDLVSNEKSTSLENNWNKYIEIETVNRKSEDSMIRSKSVAELFTDDNIKGKVHQMVVRMNSLERIEVEKKEIIEVKEIPRIRSVLEKIALFEKKVTLRVQLENAETTTTQSTTRNDSKENHHLPKPLSEEEYAKKIKELEKASEVYGKIENMPNVTLRDGTTMPVLAVGTALLDPHLIQPIIKAAIDLGYRAFDTAFIYGNEKAIGEAIRAKVEDGTVTRDELFIVNKLWNTFHRQDLVEEACNASLTAMGLSYFDLYLVHSPMSFKEGKGAVPKIANVLQYSDYDYLDAWYGMEALIGKGVVKRIGVSNFNAQQLARIYEKARIKPVVNQVECHPYLSQQRLTRVCADRGIKLSCFGVLGSKGTPDELKSNLLPVIDDPLVVVMAAGLNMTAARLLVRYQIDSGHLVVVKASSAAHLWDNLKALDLELTPTQLDALHALNRNKRTYTFKGMGDTHRNYPFKASF